MKLPMETPTEFDLLRVVAFASGPARVSHIRKTLTNLGIQLLEAADSLRILEMLLQTSPADVVVCDMLPGHDEALMVPSLLRRLRKAAGPAAPSRVLWMVDPTTCWLQAASHSAVPDDSEHPDPLHGQIGPFGIQALQAHIRLARNAGIDVAIAQGAPASTLKTALHSLMRTPDHFFVPTVPHEELPLEEELIAAISGGEGLRIVLQPQYDLATRAVVGAEALVRWTHPVHGNISPITFIPMVNRLDLNLMLFSFVKSSVIEVLSTLFQRGIHIPIAVNASVKTVSTPGLARLLAEKMTLAGLPNHLLKVELTEEMPVDDPLSLSASLLSLRALGFQTSLDDFGSGSATMNLLATMPFDEVKIDGSFVMDIDQKSPSRGIVATVSALANMLNMNLVAEGIEDEASITTLRRLGCQKGQGFALSMPVEISDFVEICLATTPA
ncbi:EAL domain-containing response regulator [Achromobacter xylosoxidans]|uniref:EAL domain-containing response regulator n=1 Tax=Alcaligenes xylosoxydans xylosoxydans TaxID=85698 RepID=UPI0013AF6BFB|nr:EAL domain-containing protein [Achromobacter xylosoxidans]